MKLFKNRWCRYFEEHGFDPKKEASTVSLYCRKKQRHIGLDDCWYCDEAQEKEE